MPYSGCYENKKLYFFEDPHGKPVNEVCSDNKNDYPLCSASTPEKFQCSYQVLEFQHCPPGKKTTACRNCVKKYNECLYSGEKICEFPDLYSDMFCTNKCKNTDESKAALCFTECKLACSSLNDCPFYMLKHCKESISCSKDIVENFEMSTSNAPMLSTTPHPTTTISPDAFFPEPTTEIPIERRMHRRLERETMHDIKAQQADVMVADVSPTPEPSTPANYYGEEDKEEKTLFIVLLGVGGFLTLLILVGIIIFMVLKRKTPESKQVMLNSTVKKPQAELPTTSIRQQRMVFPTKQKIPGHFYDMALGYNPFGKKQNNFK